MHAILAGQAPDPAELRRIDRKLAPFYCPDCGQNYCRADWHSYVLADEGSYDRTMGTCPAARPSWLPIRSRMLRPRWYWRTAVRQHQDRRRGSASRCRDGAGR